MLRDKRRVPDDGAQKYQVGFKIMDIVWQEEDVALFKGLSLLLLHTTGETHSNIR